jgi:uncharacterized protein (TIGR02246 family)
MHPSKLTISVLALTFFAIPTQAQTPDQLFTATRNQLEVTKVILAQEAAWNKGNLEAYIGFYKDAPDTQAILGSPTRGLQNIRTLFHANFPSPDVMGTLEQSSVEVRELGENFALATGKYDLTRGKKFGGNATGSFTDIFEKTPAGWRVVFSETT